MKNVFILCIMFTFFGCKTYAQSEKPILRFKNSILYEAEKKIFSYKPIGEFTFFNSNGGKGRIMNITTISGKQPILDTTNIDTLYYKISIYSGGGLEENWMFKSIIDYYKDGIIKQKILYNNDGKTGTSYSYDKKGKLHEEGNFIAASRNLKPFKKNGEWLRYNEKGGIKKKSNYDNGTQLDEVDFAANGKIFHTWKMEANDITEIYYYEDGSLCNKKELKNGNGVYIEYYEDGNMKSKETYENNKVIKKETGQPKIDRATHGVN